MLAHPVWSSQIKPDDCGNEHEYQSKLRDAEQQDHACPDSPASLIRHGHRPSPASKEAEGQRENHHAKRDRPDGPNGHTTTPSPRSPASRRQKRIRPALATSPLVYMTTAMITVKKNWQAQHYNAAERIGQPLCRGR